MKNTKALIIICVILLNVLVGYTVGQSLFGKESEYDKTISEARAYVEQDLCSKAIAKYNEAIAIDDTVELRLEMINAYKHGLEIGEFSDTYEIFTNITTMVDTYRNDVSVYEAACELFLQYEKYEDCAKVLMQARDLGITSEKLTEILNNTRYKYMKYYAMYSNASPVSNDMYTVETAVETVGETTSETTGETTGEEETVVTYSFLNSEASPEGNDGYTFASSFSEGYAFVKSIQPDGSEKGYIINLEGERQIYLDGVESSSGVGKAKDEKGNDMLVITCKVGDKYKFFDMSGNQILSDYAFAGRFRNNVAAVKEADGKWKLIDGTGKAITDTVFSDVILNEFDECAPKGLIIAKNGDKYRIYNMAAETFGPVEGFACDDAKAFVDDYAAFKNGDSWGFVGADGKVIIEPQYEDAKSFSNKMGAVLIGGVWNLINPANEIVVEETFEDVGYLSNTGICFVKFDGYWSYLKMYYTGK